MAAIPRIFLLTVLVVAATVPVRAQTRADVIILVDPAKYTIFNQYQQPLSADEARGLLPGAPLQVMQKQVTLGDQISRALKFSYRGEIGYLLTDEHGAFVGEMTRSSRESHSNCELFGDTVELLRDGMKIITVQGRTVVAQKGERLYRVFRAQRGYYVLTLAAEPPVYGWCTLEPRTAWKKSGVVSGVAKDNDTLLPSALRERLVKRIEDANRSYKEMFSHFNALTNNEKSIPRWEVVATATSLTFVLSGPWRNTDELAASTRHLQRDLETMLLGSGFWVSSGRGTLAIVRTTQGK